MTTSNILFIDPRVQDYESLVASLPAGTQWFLLDSEGDAISQMLAVLDSFSGLDSLQILSHGDSGSLLLGDSLIDADTLEGRSAELARLGSYLDAQGDILLYGCDVAAGAAGEAFIQRLAELTGADVAASTDTTGLGGDWELEASTGSIEADSLVIAGYAASLDVITGTSGDDNVLGSSALAGTAGDDSIYGLAGSDYLLDILGGSNYLDGGDGNDRLWNWQIGGSQTLLGGAGSDSIFGAGQTVSIDGGADDDVIQVSGRLNNDELAERAVFNNMLSGTIAGGTGNDDIEVTWLGNVLIQGNDGNDAINANATSQTSYQLTIEGGSGADTIRGGFDTSLNDSIGAGLGGTYVLDGGDDNDDIALSGSARRTDGAVNATLSGGSGDDTLVLSETSTAAASEAEASGGTALSSTGGLLSALLDGGDGDDVLQASGVLQLTLTGGLGSDTFVLTTQQLDTLLRGTRNVLGVGNITPEPTLITDFAAGTGGDVLDISELLQRAIDFGYEEGTDPFGTYILLVATDDGTLVLFDRDGSGSSDEAVVVATLLDVNPDNLVTTNFAPAIPTPGASTIDGQLIQGTNSANNLTGTIGDDTIYGYETLTGAGSDGNDTIHGGIGADLIYGGGNDDSLFGDYGDDTLYGGDGNDVLTDHYGSNYLDGGAGNDSISASNVNGSETLVGGTGADTITGTAKNLVIHAGDGGSEIDKIFANGFTQVNGNARYVQLGNATITGADDLEAAHWNSLLVTLDSNAGVAKLDNIRNATVNGSSGYDLIEANFDGTHSPDFGATLGASYSLSGGALDDTIVAGGYADFTGDTLVPYIQINPGMTGYAGLDGGLVQLTLDGGAGDDTLYIDEDTTENPTANTGGVAYASIDGGSGNDLIVGEGVLQLTITGGTGSDTIWITDQQYDTIVRGARTFDVTGGTQQVAAQAVLITDFETGASGDLLQLSDLLADNGYTEGDPFDLGYLKLVADGSDTLVQFDANGGGDSFVTIVRLSNVNPSSLTADNLSPGYVPNLNNTAPTGNVVITGTATEDQVLTASISGISDADGMSNPNWTYQWKANNQVIENATGSTYTLTGNEVGKTITVTVSYDDDGGTRESLTSSATSSVVNVNDPLTGTLAITGTLQEGQYLTADTQYLADEDGLGEFSYVWKSNGNLVGSNSSSLLLTEAMVGTSITLTVSYTDLQGTSESTSASIEGTVANINNLPTGSASLSGTFAQGETLAIVQNIADQDGLGSFNYQWYADSGSGPVAIQNANAATYTLTQSEVGKTITVVISYTDGHGTAETVTSAVSPTITNVNDPVSGSVSITGYTSTPKQGDVLLADTSSLSDADGLGTFSYVWTVGSETIGGAADGTLTLTQNMVGKAVSVTVSYQDQGGTTETLSSSATAEVANVNDAPSGTLIINGNFLQGNTLNLSDGITDLDGISGARSYQWYSVDSSSGSPVVTAISNATGTSLELTEALVGKSIFVRLSYTDDFGNAHTRDTSTSPQVVNVNDDPTGGLYIQGTQATGQTLTLLSTLNDADGMGTVSYQWYSNGTLIPDATGTSLLLTSALAATTITAVATWTDGHGTFEEFWTTDSPANNPPTGSLTILGQAQEGSKLTLDSNISDGDGIASDIIYTWYADDQLIHTGLEYTLTAAEVGKVITVKATYTDGMDVVEVLESTPTDTVTVLNSEPTGSVTIGGFTGTPAEGDTLTANTGSIQDGDGLGSFSYQWFADDGNGATAIDGATGASFELTQDQVGSTISVEVSWTDGRGTAESLASSDTAAVLNVNNSPTGGISILGQATEGSQLSVDTSNLVDIDGLGSFSYQWYAGANPVGTGATYTLTSEEVGQSITVVISYTDQQGSQETVTSGATSAVVGNNAPVGSVSISGSAIVGQTLSASTDVTDADGLGAFSWQWLRNGSPISNATGTSYTLTAADLGQQISVRLSYTDQASHAESLTSSTTAAVTNPGNNAPVGSVTISGSAVVGQTLSASTDVTDADGLGTLSWQWLRNGSPISNATGTSYTLTSADLGQQISVRVSYTDQASNSESLTSSSVTAASNQGVNLVGTTGDDSLVGTGNNDTLDGSAGNDTLNGGAGSDSLIGGKGNDTFVVDNEGDVVVELLKGGNDHVLASLDWILGDNLEYLTLTGSATTGTGNALKNALYGNALANTLDGGLNRDTMSGGAGDDVYIVDNKKDYLIEDVDGGHDTVYTSSSWKMQLNVEDVFVVADAALTISVKGNISDNYMLGHAGIDKLSGSDGNDTLDGGAGADKLTGGTGDDVYYIDNALDKVKESASSAGGNDVAYASTSWTLAKGVETLYLTGSANLSALGSKGSDVIYGNSGANTLNGLKGNDTLYGGAGNDLLIGDKGYDVLVGGDGNDTLYGGANADELTGGAGADVFVFSAIKDSYIGKTQEIDWIIDFEVGVDKIDLSGLGVTIDSIIYGEGPDTGFTQAGQLWLLSDGLLQINLDNDTTPEMYIDVGIGNHLTLSDFIL